MSLLCQSCLQLALLSLLAAGATPTADVFVSGPPAPPAVPPATLLPPVPATAPEAALGPGPVSTTAAPVASGTGESVDAQNRVRQLEQQLRQLGLSAPAARHTSRATEAALVVPSTPMEPQSADALVEDLTIMSRILQKSLADGYLLPEMSATDSLIINLTLPSQNVGPRLFFPLSRRPKALYVGDYGALFFLQVDFPLVPPAEQAEQTGAEESDPVWSEARRMLYGPSNPGLVANATPTESYSEEKVALLRGRLIELMRHATNIRTLDPNDSVTIVVRGTVAEDGRPPVDAFTGLPSEAPCGRTVLTLRARKPDIDLYAKGQLDPAQFEQRVQITNYKQ